MNRQQKSGLARYVMLAALSVLMMIGSSAMAQTIVGSLSGAQVITDPANGNKKVRFTVSTGGALEVAPFAPDVARVQFHWDGIWSKEDVGVNKQFGQWPAFNATFQDEGNIYRIITSDLEIEIVKSPNAQVHFKSPQGFYLSRDSYMEYNTQYDPISDPSYINIRYSHALPLGFKLKANRDMPAGEAYFGFGEYAGPANRRGRTIQGWNSDTFSWQEGWTPMYMTMPFFYGSQGAVPGRPAYTYGLFFNNQARPVFHMGTQAGNRYSFEAADGQIDYFFFAGGNTHQMRRVLNRYTELTGAPTKLPKWAYGYHMSRWSYNNQSWVQWLAQEFRNRDYPLDAIYLDIDYFDTTPNDYYLDNSLHQLTFNSNFPNPPGMVQYTGERGVKIVPIIEAWLTPTDPKYGEAWNQFHFLKNYNYQQVNTPIYFGNVSWLDFSSSPARTWWKNKLVGFFNWVPMAGMWNDLNEPADIGDNPYAGIPLNGQYWLDGRYPNAFDSRKFHLNEKNLYCVREVSLSYEALLQKYPGKRPFVLSRAGFPGIQKYALGWSGDNVASWDHCRHNIGLGVSVMMSGQANFGHDVGGFVNSTTGELITRWHEWAAFNPFFRNHSTKWDAEREPWRFGDYFGGLLRTIIKKRYQFMPYLYTLAHQSTVDGVPMNTPTVMHFQHDPGTHWLNDNDFMVGDYLLVSPIFNPGQTVRTTYLPSGTDWYNWYTGSKHVGGADATQTAQLGTIPMYARAGAIIPMGPPMAHANQFQANFMDLHVFPTPAGFSSEFTLHEDDGETFDFLAGAYARTRFVSSRTASNYTFVIHAREGSYETGARHYFVKVRDLDAPTSVKINGTSVPLDGSHAANQCYSYDAGARLLTVKVQDTRAHTTVDVGYIPNYKPITWVGNVSNVPTNGAIQPTDNLWINAQSFPQGAGTGAEVIYSVNSGATWATNAMNANGVAGQNDAWNRNLGTFASGTPVWYWVRVRDSQNVVLTNNNGGAFYRVTIGVFGPELTWIGSSHNWPLDGSITTNDNVWVNTYTYPRQASQLTQVVISTNQGVSWVTNAMVKAGVSGNDDWWHLNLGKYVNGTKLWYWTRGTDSYGTTKIDKNNNAFYKVTVGTPAIAIVWAGNPDQYPVNGSIKATDDVWLNVESWPKQSGVLAEAIISTNQGVTWFTNSMNLAGTRSNGANDWWNRNLGKFSNGTKLWYWMRVTDGNGTARIVDNNGAYYKTTVGTLGPQLVWAGNVDQYPANGSLNSSTDLWLNLESWPKQAATSVKVFYTNIPNTSYLQQSMNLAGTRSNGANDWFNLNMGKWVPGNLYYYFEVTDSHGLTIRVPATGTYQAVIQ